MDQHHSVAEANLQFGKARLGSGDFPIHKLTNPDNRLSGVRSDTQFRWMGEAQKNRTPAD